MSIHFGGDVERVYHGEDIQEVYFGSELVWSARPRPKLWAKFGTTNMVANSGSDGGDFALTGYISPRQPQGAYFPLASEISNGPLPFADGVTMMGWVKASRALITGVPFWLTNGFGGVAIGQDSLSAKSLTLQDRLFEGGPFVSVNRSASVGEWLHLALVAEPRVGSTIRLSLYVNGKLAGMSPSPGDFGPDPLSLVVGTSWEGDIGQVRAYDLPLTAIQVDEIYEEERATYGHGPDYIRDRVRHVTNWGGDSFTAMLNTWQTVVFIDITEHSRASGTWSVIWNAPSVANCSSRVLVGGTVVASTGPTNFSSTSRQTQSVSIPETDLSPGQRIAFQVYTDGSTTTRRGVFSTGISLS